MAKPGLWCGDEWRSGLIRRGLAAELGPRVADDLRLIARETVRKMDTRVSPQDRNDAIAFLALCIGDHMRAEG